MAKFSSVRAWLPSVERPRSFVSGSLRRAAPVLVAVGACFVRNCLSGSSIGLILLILCSCS